MFAVVKSKSTTRLDKTKSEVAVLARQSAKECCVCHIHGHDASKDPHFGSSSISHACLYLVRTGRLPSACFRSSTHPKNLTSIHTISQIHPVHLHALGFALQKCGTTAVLAEAVPRPRAISGGKYLNHLPSCTGTEGGNSTALCLSPSWKCKTHIQSVWLGLPFIKTSKESPILCRT